MSGAASIVCRSATFLPASRLWQLLFSSYWAAPQVLYQVRKKTCHFELVEKSGCPLGAVGPSPGYCSTDRRFFTSFRMTNIKPLPLLGISSRFCRMGFLGT